MLLHDVTLQDVLFAGVLLPLAAAAIEIRHKKSEDIILVRVDAETLEEAELDNAYLRGADLRHAALRNASLAYADLREADLLGADLREADLTGANLRGADLSASKLDGCVLVGAKYNRHTRWPEGFDPRDYNASAE